MFHIAYIGSIYWPLTNERELDMQLTMVLHWSVATAAADDFNLRQAEAKLAMEVVQHHPGHSSSGRRELCHDLGLPSGPIFGTRAIVRIQNISATLKYNDVLVSCAHPPPRQCSALVPPAPVGLTIGTCGGSGALRAGLQWM